VTILLLALLAAADWPQFRGPNGSGIADDKDLPVQVGKRNLVWKTPLPPGHSSPVIAGQHIFVTAHEGRALLTIALDRATGRELWRKQAPRPRAEGMAPGNSPASPTPVTDGASVWVFFGDFGVLSYNAADGAERWRAPLGPFNNANGHGSSPVLVDDKVILICDQDTDSFLLALDKNTGQVRWKTARPEVTRGYATPVIYQPPGGPKELIVPGAYQVIAYRADTGEKLWWVEGMAWQLKSVAAIGDGIIYVSGWEIGGDFERSVRTQNFEEALAAHDTNRDGRIGPGEAPAGGIREMFPAYDLNGDRTLDAREWNFLSLQRGALNNVVAIRHGGRGDLTATNVLWRYRKSLPNTPSPLLYRDVLYLVKDGGIVTALDPKTGRVHKQARLPGAAERYWASPVAGDGKVYLLSDAGKLMVLRAGKDWDVIGASDLEEECYATPAIVDGRLYVRTRVALYCFAKRD